MKYQRMTLIESKESELLYKQNSAVDGSFMEFIGCCPIAVRSGGSFRNKGICLPPPPKDYHYEIIEDENLVLVLICCKDATIEKGYTPIFGVGLE